MPPSPSERIRLGAVMLAGAAGAGLGILLGLSWLLSTDGEGVEALAVATLAVVLSLAVLFQLMVARAVARLHERPAPAAGSDDGPVAAVTDEGPGTGRGAA